MAHFAQLDENNIVTQVIVVSNDDCLDSDGSESKLGIAFCKNLLGADTNWVRTSYNNNIRFRYAGIGMKYDSTNDVFLYQQPFPSWVLNTSTWDWEAPVALPDDAGFNDEDPPTKLVTYDWDEDELEWNNKTTHTWEAPVALPDDAGFPE